MAEMSMVERVGRAIAEANQEDYMEFAALHDAMARAAIEAMPVDEYYLRCAKFVEGVRETYGHGYGEGDIERMFRIFAARDLIFLKYNNASKHIAKAVDDAIDAIMRGETPPPALKTALNAQMEASRKRREAHDAALNGQEG